MGVRVKRYSKALTRENNPIVEDLSQEGRETTFDGQTFHWGTNEVRNFIDDGVGLGHVGYAQGSATIVEDTLPFGDSRS